MVSRETFAPLLREHRLRAHLSRAKLGRACGLSEATITALEKGERRLTGPLLYALCGVQALRFPPLQVAGGGEWGLCPAVPPIPGRLLPPPTPQCLSVARFPVWLAREVSWIPRPRAEARCKAPPVGRCLTEETRAAMLDTLAEHLVGFTVGEVTEALYRAALRRTRNVSRVARLLGVSRRTVYGHLPAKHPGRSTHYVALATHPRTEEPG